MIPTPRRPSREGQSDGTIRWGQSPLTRAVCALHDRAGNRGERRQAIADAGAKPWPIPQPLGLSKPALATFTRFRRELLLRGQSLEGQPASTTSERSGY